MAKKKEIEEIEVVETPKEKEPKIPMTEYTIKNRVKVGGIWKEKNDKIKLTKEGFDFFKSKNYI